eukprot:445504-Pelagomonas_calceolata.AAC.5
MYKVEVFDDKVEGARSEKSACIGLATTLLSPDDRSLSALAVKPRGMRPPSPAKLRLGDAEGQLEQACARRCSNP